MSTIEVKGKLVLRSKKDQALRRFHPWVFSNAIKESEGEFGDGDCVEVQSNKGKYLGIGHYQESGSISVRMLSFFNEQIDENFLSQRVNNAWNTREKLGLYSDTNNCFRLIFAEGDRLPGLIADFYAGVVVMQCHSSGMFHSRHLIAEALMSLEAVTAVYCKISSSLKKVSQEPLQDELIAGEVPEKLIATENGIKFLIDWKDGQKTGFFLDQRENRLLIGEISKGKKVLNTFCYTGGFSMFSLLQEAELVHSLDSSQPALDLLEENLKLNGFDGKNHTSVCADAIEHIKDLPEDYDIIILDPPAFAKSRHSRHNAVQGYKRLNAAAIRQIKPGGIIATFSCSQVVDYGLFYHTIVAAGISAEREIKVLKRLIQPGDHPCSIFHPEGEYLKGLLIEVL